jgi:hypothetical protein
MFISINELKDYNQRGLDLKEVIDIYDQKANDKQKNDKDIEEFVNRKSETIKKENNE